MGMETVADAAVGTPHQGELPSLEESHAGDQNKPTYITPTLSIPRHENTPTDIIVRDVCCVTLYFITVLMYICKVVVTLMCMSETARGGERAGTR